MADVVFECPKCKQRLEAPPEMMGQPIACPTCSHSLHIPFSKKSLQAISHKSPPSPTSGYYDSRYKSIISSILKATQAVEEHLINIKKFQAHSTQHYCFQCKLWVEPHYDYEQVSSGGGGFMLDNGMVVVRQNNSTREFIRCSQCGKRLINSSGAEWAAREIEEYNSVNRRLRRLRQRELKWLCIVRAKDTHPILASVRRFHWGFPWVFPSLIIIMLIGVSHSLHQHHQKHLVASALNREANSSFYLAISATRPYDRLCNLRNYVKRFPDSAHIPEALTMLSELEKEYGK